MSNIIEGNALEGFGLREFQLHVLAYMPYSERMGDALDVLDATVEDTKVAMSSAKQIGIARFLHEARLEFSILGEPLFNEDLDPALIEDRNDLKGTKVYGFDLPVFSDYVYLINVSVDGIAWGERFVRRPGVVCPPIGAVEDLQTWRYLKDEVVGVLDGATWIDGFSFNEIYSGRMFERRSGGLVDIHVDFDFGLLQWVRRVDSENG